MPTLKQIIEGNDTLAGRAFDFVTEGLIVLSMITFSLETLPNLSDASARALSIVEGIVVVLFTFEYIARVAVAAPRRFYVFSFFGIIDLVSILPFYLGTGIDLRTLRAFRLLRLFRILKLARYSAAVRRFHIAINIAKEEIVLFLCATSILLFLASVGIYYFESEAQPATFGSIFHCLWWAVITLTTVGYGDVYPITAGGKVFTFLVLIIGLGVISVPAGLVASALAKARQLEEEERLNRTPEATSTGTPD